MKPNYQKSLAWLKEKSPFPSKLRQFMADTHTTQEQLANAIGVTKQTVSAYINGQRVPDIYRVQQIADYFKVDIGELLGNGGSLPHSICATKIRNILTQTVIELEKLREEYVDD